MTSSIRNIFLAWLLAGGAVSPVFSQGEFFTDWTYYKKITLNTSPSGADAAGNVNNFPVLIRLTSANFDFGQARDDGGDVRFSMSNGAELQYEIERWDKTGKTAEIWVRVTQIMGNDDAQYIVMYWGNAQASGAGASGAVFQASNNFQGVWHLGENGNTAAGGYADATDNQYHGTGVGMTDSSGRAGAIGMAQDFFPGSHVLIPGSAASALNFPEDGAYTVSAWVNLDAYNGDYQAIVSKGDLQYILQAANNNVWQFTEFQANTGFDKTSSPAVTGTWVLLTGVRNGAGNQMLYVNGVEADNSIETWPSPNDRNLTYDVAIGFNTQSNQPFDGRIDEVRLSSTVRSADWIKLCYENQKPAQTLAEPGSIVKRVGTPAQENYAAGWRFYQHLTLNTSGTGADVAGTVTGFPILVRLTASNFDFSLAKSDGSDIRFSTTDNTQLFYEIERWDSGLERAEIWVGVDSIAGGSSTQTVRMQWGNPDAQDNSVSELVFGTDKGFAGVWHLNLDTAGGDGPIPDAASNSHDGTNTGTASVTGNISGAANFSGSDYIDLPAVALSGLGNVITLSAWQYGDAGLQPQMDIFFEAYNASSQRVISIHLPWNDSQIMWDAGNSGTNFDRISKAATSAEFEGAWNYWTFTKNVAAQTMEIFLNGELFQSGTGKTFGFDAVSRMKLGSQADGTNYYYDGYIDEFRLSLAVRSGDWIKLCYENQKLAQTLVEFGAVVDRTLPDTTPTVFENYTDDWRYSAEITLNTTASGANILENQVNFPVLIRLDGNTFRFDQAAEHGNDIRFANANGMPLAYDIEGWDNSAEQADIWVRADTVFGSRRQTILMYWGNPVAVDSSSGINVFHESDSYAAVYHMNEDPSGGTGAVKDRTSHGFDATAYGSMASEDLVEGPAGQAIAFDGNNDYLDLGAFAADFSGGMTVCAWVRFQEFNNWSRIADCSRNSTGENIILANTAETDALFWANRLGGTVQIGGALVPDVWSHVCGTLEVDAADTIMHLYRDGVRIGSDLNAAALSDSGFTSCFIGKSHFPGDKMFEGEMDEVRLSTVPRSPDWIRLSYENQKFNQALVEMTAPGPAGGDSVVYIGAHAKLIVPSGMPVPPIGFQSLDPSGIPEGFRVAGPALVFDPVGFGQPVTVSLELDTALVGVADRGKVRIYERIGAVGEIWTLIEPRVSGNWFSFSTDTLGTYILALDTLPPVMTLLPGTDASQGGSLAFIYDAADNTWNPAVTLVVRQGGSGETRIPLPNIPGTIQTDTIPAIFISGNGLSYRLEVTDGVNTHIGPVADVTVGVTESMVMDYNLTAGAYQMFSIPLKSSLTVSRLFYPAWGGFNQDAWRLYRYDGTFIEYQEGDNSLPAPGQVFWLKTVGFTPSVVLPPGAMTTNPVSRPYAVSLNPGWNFVSNPFAFDVRMDSLRAVNGGGPQFIYTYDPAAKIWMPGDALTSLETWRGYLVWNSLTGPAARDSLWIPPVEYMGILPKLAAGLNGSSSMAVSDFFLPPETGGKISISVSSGTEQDGLAAAGFNMAEPDAGAQYPKPGFWPQGLEIYFAGNQAGEKAKYLTDYRGPLGRGQAWTFTVENRTGNSAARLEFTGLEQLPDSLKAVLLDPGRGKIIPLTKPAADYLQSKQEAESFQLLVGTPEYIGEKTRVFKARFGGLLEQNAPNPFSASTRIIYRVPFAGDGSPVNLKVNLDIFDLNGKHITTPVSGRQASGLREVMWDRRNSGGRAVPAGAYIYRLRVGEGMGAQRKMLVVE